MNKIEYEELITFHPEYYTQEIIDDMEITQEEFSKRIETTVKTLSELINGQIELPEQLALHLSNMLGTSVDVWLNIQKVYTEKSWKFEKKNVMNANVWLQTAIIF